MKYHHDAHIKREKNLGFACGCSFSTLNSATLERRDESKDTRGPGFITHLPAQGNPIQTQGLPSDAKASLAAAPLLPLPSPAVSRVHTAETQEQQS